MSWRTLALSAAAWLLLMPAAAHATDGWAVGQSCPTNGATAGPNLSGQSVICTAGVWALTGGAWGVNSTNYYYNTGAVGIGTTSPQSALQINGGEVQIGSSGASCATANAGAMRYASGTMYYCNGSAWNPFSSSCLGGSTGSDASLASGLVAYWNFNEDTGLTTFDDTGNGNNGLFNGTSGSQWVTGIIGSGLSFNGSNNYVSTPVSVNYSALTVSVWVKFSSVSGNSRVVANAHTDVSPFQGFELARNGSTGFSFYVGNGTANVAATSTQTVSTGTWYHLVGTYNGTTVKIYVNGVVGGTTGSLSGSIASSLYPLAIGYDSAYSGDYVTGIIDEVGVWNVALTSTQVSTLYNSGSGDAFNPALICPVVLVGGTTFAN